RFVDPNLTVPALKRASELMRQLAGGTIAQGYVDRYPSDEWQADGPPVEDLLQIEIEDPDLCARYTGAVIQGVKLGPSPAWMQRRITLAGMRPINNIVDITNYVMLEMGQPLHAFDYHAVEGHKIVVRRARRGERLTTLDHVDRQLDPKMLAICDVSRPLALAGVMGGEDSEIGESSNDVLLESAHFNQLNIRRTARLLRLPSEASYRFERFVDPNLTVPALKRASELMRQLAGGTIAQGYVDRYPSPRKPLRIHFYTSEVDRLLGIHVPPSRIANILQRLDFTVDLPPNADIVGPDTTMLVDVPSYRNDVALPADLVEEVARIMGYDTIPETLIEGGLPPQHVDPSLQNEERLQDIMAACGVDEVITYGVTYSGDLEKLARMEAAVAQVPTAEGDSEAVPVYRSWDTARPPVTIVNPLSSKQDVMRPTLLPNLLHTLRENLKMQPETPVCIFEVGKVYLTSNESEVEARQKAMQEELATYPRLQAWEFVPGEDRLPMEPRRLMGMMSGPRQPRSRFNPDVQGEAEYDFFDAKGVVEELLRRLHVGGVEYLPARAPLFHPGRVALVRAQGVDLGAVGELHPALLEEWEVPARRVCAWDLDVEALARVMPERALYDEVSPYAPVRQDMAFVVAESTPAALVAGAIRKAAPVAIADVDLFDIYTGKPVPEGHKSLAFAVTFTSTEKPLTEEEIARLRRRIEGRLERELGARLR
ncbi:MAG: phenylalanine--tRNA ligase subunit beta, partial [Chloroflexia bacterium]